MTELSSYVIETLWEDEEFALSRFVSDREPSPHLALTPAAAQPGPETLTRLEHAYAMRDEFDPAWAARPVELEHHWKTPASIATLQQENSERKRAENELRKSEAYLS